MLIRSISKFNLIEIILLPLIFIGIFIVGVGLLIHFKIDTQEIYAGWCLISGAVVMCIVLAYTYVLIKDKWKDR